MMKPISRRTLLKSTAALTAGVVLTGRPRPVRAAPEAGVESTAVISQQPEFYCGWPTLTRRKNGELLVVWSGGREAHVCPFGRVEMMRSADRGETWSWPRVLLDGPIDDRDAGVLETDKGTILVTTFTSLAYKPTLEKMKAAGSDSAPPDERLNRWKAADERVSPAQQKDALGVWMMRSVDGGVTFSGRYDVPVNSPHGPIQLSDGRLLYAGKDLWRKGARVGVCESTDDGKSWQWLADVPTRKGDDHEAYHELHAVDAGDGRIVVHIRNHNKPNSRETLQTESTDGGKTWSEPHAIGVWGLPSHLLRLADGRLLMSYGHRRPPFGCQARVSDDGGRTWSDPLMISTDGVGGDLGYPSTVQFDDGSLLTVWYEKIKTSPKAVLRQARWKLA